MNGPTADVVVVGGGLAGLSAATRACERGLSVLLLERGRDERYLCNSRIASGFFSVAAADVRNDPQALREAIAEATGTFSDPDQVELVASAAGPALGWLRARGARTIGGALWSEGGAVLVPPMPQRSGLNWQGRGPDVTLRRLMARFEEIGGTVMHGVEARDLVIDHGRVVAVGVIADSQRFTISTSAVVLADGGFQANPDLIRRYICATPAALCQSNSGSGVGDGLLMAETAGAAMVGMDRFYGHLLARDAIDNDRLWPHPTLDAAAVNGMAVTADGYRFTDEGLGGISIANAIARLPDPLGAFAIFDDDTWHIEMRQAAWPAHPLLVQAGATIFMADTLEGLAPRAGIAAPALTRTVGDFNRAVAGELTEHLSVPRSVDRHRPQQIARPPFYAVPLCAGIFYTMGGPAIDGHCRVRHRSGGTVPGLYAAGATAGGLEGGPRSGYVGGLAKAAVTGLRAADSIADALAGAAARAG